jgi:hypothetical protein
MKNSRSIRVSMSNRRGQRRVAISTDRNHMPVSVVGLTAGGAWGPGFQPTSGYQPNGFWHLDCISWKVAWVQIIRRLGASPRERGSSTDISCPDIFELADGRFAVIGAESTLELQGSLPGDASCAPYERIVVITRETLLRAKADIPDA